MTVRSPEELEFIGCPREAAELRGPGVDYWTSWTPKNHFSQFTEAELRSRAQLSAKVLEAIKRTLD